MNSTAPDKAMLARLRSIATTLAVPTVLAMVEPTLRQLGLEAEPGTMMALASSYAMAIATVSGTTAAAIQQNIIAGEIDRASLKNQADSDRLFNRDLARAIGFTFATIISRTLGSRANDQPWREILKDTPALWSEISKTDVGNRLESLTEDKVVEAIVNNPAAPSFEPMDDSALWFACLGLLANQAGVGTSDLQSAFGLKDVVSACNKTFRQEFFDTLKHDLENGGKTYAGVTLRALGQAMYLLKKLAKTQDRQRSQLDRIVELLHEIGDRLVVAVGVSSNAYEVFKPWLDGISGKLDGIALDAAGAYQYARSADEKIEELTKIFREGHATSKLSTQERLEAEIASQDATTAFAFIDEIFSSIDPSIARGRDVTVIDLLEISSHRSATLLNASPGAEALVRGALGRAYNQVGRIIDAEREYKKAYSLAKTAWGEDHQDTITAGVGYAISQLGLGKYQTALELLRDAGARRARTLGADHALTIQIVDFEVIALSRLYRFEEALPLCRRVVANREKHLGANDAETLSSINGLSDLLQQMDSTDEAERLSASVSARADVVLGEDSPVALEAHSIHASQLLKLGKYPGAVEELLRLTGLQERVLGKMHSSTLISLDVLQKALWGIGEKQRSETIAREVVDRCNKTLGPDNPRTLTYLNNLANLLREARKFDEAEAIFPSVIERSTAVLGSNHPQALTAKYNYALLMMDRGEYSPSIPLLSGVVKGLEQAYSATHWKSRAARGVLAEAIALSGGNKGVVN